MDKKKAGSTPIALRVLKELVLPLAGGAAYGTLVAQAKQMPLDGVTAGGVAFFCILAAQGLVLRAARTARHEPRAPAAVSPPAPEPLKLPAPERAPEKEPEPAPALIAAPIVEPLLKPIVEPVAKPVDEPAPLPAPPPPPPAPPKPANDFVSIRVGIEELKEQGALPEPEPEKPEDGQRPLFRNLAHAPTKRTPVEALAPKQLLDLKMPYQAVLNAAVNFEREVKRLVGMEGDRTASLESLFEDPRFNLSKDRLRQLDTLRRIRNNILHGFETLVDPIEAAALVAAFDRAASWFDSANVEPLEPPTAEAETPAKDEAEKPAEDDVEGRPNMEAEKPAEEMAEEAVKAEQAEPADEVAKAPVEDETKKFDKDEPEKSEPEQSVEPEKKTDAVTS